MFLEGTSSEPPVPTGTVRRLGVFQDESNHSGDVGEGPNRGVRFENSLRGLTAAKIVDQDVQPNSFPPTRTRSPKREEEQDVIPQKYEGEHCGELTAFFQEFVPSVFSGWNLFRVRLRSGETSTKMKRTLAANRIVIMISSDSDTEVNTPSRRRCRRLALARFVSCGIVWNWKPRELRDHNAARRAFGNVAPGSRTTGPGPPRLAIRSARSCPLRRPWKICSGLPR